MERARCPYLGLKDDPTTSLDFPSEGNFCHHANPVAPVDRNYQKQYCLSEEHTACPIFIAAHPQPLPAALTGTSPRIPTRRILAILSIPILLAGTTVAAMAWNGISSRTGSVNGIPVSQAGLPGSWSLLQPNAPDSSGSLPGVLPTLAPSNEPKPAYCPMPEGWVRYTVNPTDSLYRLSVIYGVSVEQLQAVNCLGDKAVILPGQVIYLPNLPTETPDPTATPLAINTPLPGNNNPVQPQPTATPVPPQPTSTPEPRKPNNSPTPVPPTQQKGKQQNNNGGNNGNGQGNGQGNDHGKGKGKGKGKGH